MDNPFQIVFNKKQKKMEISHYLRDYKGMKGCVHDHLLGKQL